MFQSHPYITAPSNVNAKIWKYMDISKLISILENSSLYFSRADKFKDPYEGHFSQNEDLNYEPYKKEEKISRELISKLHSFQLKDRHNTYLNCWHLNEFESSAMWSLYLKSNEGIAIQSTYKRFCDSLIQDKPDVYVGLVKYINYEKQWVPDGNSLLPFMHKRLSFAHENELRAIIQDLTYIDGKINMDKPKYEDGFLFKVDPSTLIESIYISPLAEDWIHDIISALLKKYNFSSPIFKSILYKSPT